MKKNLIILLLLIPIIGFTQIPDLLSVSKYQALPTCTPLANNQYTTGDAASDLNCNETNGVGGWTTSGTGTTIEAITSDVFEGTYALKITAAGGVVAFAQRSFAVTAGDTFTITMAVKRVQGSFVRLTAWQNCTGQCPSFFQPSTSWTVYNYEVEAVSTGNMAIRVYAGSSTASASGDNVLIDKISIVKTN